jgi:hypothetical protein
LLKTPWLDRSLAPTDPASSSSMVLGAVDTAVQVVSRSNGRSVGRSVTFL